EEFVYYDDGNSLQPGTDDYALIKDFNRSEADILNLAGSLDDYSLRQTELGLPGGLGIFYEPNGAESELIAILEDFSIFQPSSIVNSSESFGNTNNSLNINDIAVSI
ncbi:MAG: hypothetical protein AAFX46_18650, partial [Cyanobacteria bacterium J06636_27]